MPGSQSLQPDPVEVWICPAGHLAQSLVSFKPSPGFGQDLQSSFTDFLLPSSDKGLEAGHFVH